MNQYGQLSRYGAISKSYPLTTGQIYFLISSSEYAAAEVLKTYPSDSSGNSRVFTTWAAVIAQAQLNTDADVIIVSPLFTTPPTKAQQQQLDAANATCIQAGSLLPDGSYLSATITALSEAATTTNNLFSVNGRVELIDIMGEVVTTSATAQTKKLTLTPTVGTATDLCATASTASLAVGGQMTITGTLANAMVTTVQGAFIKQATGLILSAGTLQLITSATTAGNSKWRLRYKAIDPGAFIAPLI